MDARTEVRSLADSFLTAVARRDHAKFLTYFKPELEFFAVLPGGRVFANVSDFLASQDSWFSGHTGKFSYEIRDAYGIGSEAFVFTNVIYENIGAGGQSFRMHIYISFIFRKIDGAWYLTHDQNTIISQTSECS